MLNKLIIFILSSHLRCLFQIIKAVRRYLHDFVLQIFLGIQYERKQNPPCLIFAQSCLTRVTCVVSCKRFFYSLSCNTFYDPISGTKIENTL